MTDSCVLAILWLAHKSGACGWQGSSATCGRTESERAPSGTAASCAAHAPAARRAVRPCGRPRKRKACHRRAPAARRAARRAAAARAAPWRAEGRGMRPAAAPAAAARRPPASRQGRRARRCSTPRCAAAERQGRQAELSACLARLGARLQHARTRACAQLAYTPINQP